MFRFRRVMLLAVACVVTATGGCKCHHCFSHKFASLCELTNDPFWCSLVEMPEPEIRPAPDSDGDNLLDTVDNCLLVPNPDQSDLDGDGLGDFCDCDADGDFFPSSKAECGGDDCDDLNAAINPGIEESFFVARCDDSLDNDCDGLTDDDDECRPCFCGDLAEPRQGLPVNHDDFAIFEACFAESGPTVDCPQESFDCADMNQDGAIDLADFLSFVGVFGTVNTMSPPDCEG